MPLAALQAARGAPLAGLSHAPEGREGREAGLVTRGHGRCGPRRARARGSPCLSAEIRSVLRRSMGPRGPIYSSGEVSVFVVLVWRLSLDL